MKFTKQSQEIIEEEPAIYQDDEANNNEYFDCKEDHGSFEVFEASVIGEEVANEDLRQSLMKTGFRIAYKKIDARVPRIKAEMAWRIALFLVHKTNMIAD